MRRAFFAAFVLVASTAAAQAPRAADDFERAALERQIARERDPIATAAAWINLGDLDAARGERDAARERFVKAHSIALDAGLRARRNAHLTDYATATSYAALAAAKLGRRPETFELLEESIRYLGDSAKSWNLYASSMMVLGEDRKAAAAARNAVEIARRAEEESPTAAHLLDLGIYQYTLASSLVELDSAEASRVLEGVLTSLADAKFDSIRRDVARREAFEVFTSTTNDAESYLAVHNRAGLRLAKLYETRGDRERARATYERVLAARSDEPIALAALARLASTADEKRRWFAAAFDANPFSAETIRAYEAFVGSDGDDTASGSSVSSRMRRGVGLLARGETTKARAIFDALLREHPNNATLQALVRRASASGSRPNFLTTAESQVIDPPEKDLRGVARLLRDGRATAEERRRLDELRFTSDVTFDSGQSQEGLTTFAAGRIGAFRFRFAEPTSFLGDFSDAPSLRLEYRVVGVTEIDGEEALLVEPLRVVRG